jgi:phosphate transport system protein
VSGRRTTYPSLPVTAAASQNFRRELESIDRQVLGLFALVAQCLAGATEALLDGDREGARLLIARDDHIDATYRDIEDLVLRQLGREIPPASDLRFLLGVLRIVPELERSADLATHIASRAMRGLTPDLTPRVRGLIQSMGQVGVEMWHRATDAYAERDAEARRSLDADDDELDDLHVSLTSEISTGRLSTPVAIELALVGRFYERLGDHAVNITAHVRYMATGGR